MIVFIFPEFEYLLPYFREAGIKTGDFNINRYPNRELYTSLKTEVKRQKCAIVGTIAPPENNFAEFTLLAHTLKKGGGQVIAVLPYLGYARQDKAKPGESLGVQWAGNLLAASGVEQIVSIDLHSPADAELLPLPVKSLSPARVLADAVEELRVPDITVVATDEGAVERARQVASAAGAKQFVFLKKVRSKGVVHPKIVGKVTDSAIMVDDILDTGETLISAAKQLKDSGVKDIIVAVSHGLFTGQKWQHLWQLGVHKIYCLDTIPAVTAMKDPRIKVIPCGPLLAQALSRLQ